MNGHRHVPIEEMDFFRSYVEVCDWAWRVVNGWPRLAQDTVGKQLIRAADRVPATLVEGDGRHTDADAAHFFTIARASARETRFWIQRAIVRELLPASEGDQQIARLVQATRQLNGLIRYRRQQTANGRRLSVREEPTSFYGADQDPFHPSDGGD